MSDGGRRMMDFVLYGPGVFGDSAKERWTAGADPSDASVLDEILTSAVARHKQDANPADYSLTVYEHGTNKIVIDQFRL